jgi:hypothetical protein
MRLRTTAPGSEAHRALLCAACGLPIADSLSRLGSVRCHDCRDVDAPIPSEVPTETTGPRELAHRSAAGLAVSLLWFERTGRLAVRVLDSTTGDRFEMSVERDDALNAFHHPFAYMASRRAKAARSLSARTAFEAA